MPTFITAPLPQLGDTLKAAAHLIEQLSPGPSSPTSLSNPTASQPHRPHEPRPYPRRPRRRPVHQPTPRRRAQRRVDHRPHPGGGRRPAGRGPGHLTIMTLAPERPGALAAIRQLAGHGVLVSVGHSDALAWQVAEAADAGARMVTHLFNGQRPLHHREPGVRRPGAGRSPADQRPHRRLPPRRRPGDRDRLRRRPGPDRPGHRRRRGGRDAARAVSAGGPADRAAAGDGVPPVRPDGTLAGSALRMDVAVSNMVSVGVSLPSAVAAATASPRT